MAYRLNRDVITTLSNARVSALIGICSPDRINAKNVDALALDLVSSTLLRTGGNRHEAMLALQLASLDMFMLLGEEVDPDAGRS